MTGEAPAAAQPADRSRVACLVGNGASMAYDPGLSVAALTGAVIDAIQRVTVDGGGTGDPANDPALEALTALTGFARAISGTDPSGFEQLLSPLDAAASALPALRDLRPLGRAATDAASGVGTVGEALDRTEAFLREVHRLGVSAALEVIDAKTAAHLDGRFGTTIQAFVDALAAAVDQQWGSLTVATLNYDPLLHVGFFNPPATSGADGSWFPREPSTQHVTDLADGRQLVYHKLTAGDGSLGGYRLRDADDFLPGRAVLLQLHGSLAWLRHPDTDDVWRFNMEDVRLANVDDGLSYWQAWRDGHTEWTPAVVLTNRKDRAVQRRPFDLAYRVFARRLDVADRWLIAGYGLGDGPVNAALHDAVRRRRDRGSDLPLVLVVDHGKTRDKIRTDVAALLGLKPEEAGQRVLVNCDGIPACVESAEWKKWSRA